MYLGGSEYTPRYPIMSCIALENATEKSVITLLDELATKKVPSIAMLAAVIWGGMIADQPQLTQEQVIQMLQEGDAGQFRTAYKECMEALYASMTHLLFGTDESAGTEDGAEKN